MERAGAYSWDSAVYGEQQKGDFGDSPLARRGIPRKHGMSQK